eukprot:3419740-Amphidinium_carterae.1
MELLLPEQADLGRKSLKDLLQVVKGEAQSSGCRESKASKTERLCVWHWWPHPSWLALSDAEDGDESCKGVLSTFACQDKVDEGSSLSLWRRHCA